MLDLSFEFSNYSKEKIELKKHCADAPQGRWNKGGMGRLPFPLNFGKNEQNLACSIKVHLFWESHNILFVQWNLDLRKPDLRKNLDLRKIVGTTDFLVHKLFDLRKIF